MTFAEQQRREHIERQRRLGISPARRPVNVLAPPLVPQAEDAASEVQARQVERLRREIRKLSSRLREIVCDEESPLVMPSRIKPVIRAVAKFYGVSVGDLVSGRRTHKLIRPRHVAMYLARELTCQSLPAIGRMMERDHTSILHGCQRIAELRQVDEELDAELRSLTRQLAPAEPTLWLPKKETSS